MPAGRDAGELSPRTGATLAIHLSVHVLDQVVADLTPHYGADCPVAVVWRASWPDQRIVRATLATLQTAIGAEMERTALILVGRALGAEDFDESRLYAGDYDRRYRPVGTDPRFPEARHDPARPDHLGPRLGHRQDHGDAGPAGAPCARRAWRCSRSRAGPTTSTRPFMRAASGRPSVNLDSWAMARGPDRRADRAGAEAADLVLAEGSMGLFDGVAQPGEAGTGASADLAALIGWPVVLVLDVSGQAQSAAAVALGFARDAARACDWRA